MKKTGRMVIYKPDTHPYRSLQTVLRNKNLQLRVLHMQANSMQQDLLQQLTGQQVPSLSEGSLQW